MKSSLIKSILLILLSLSMILCTLPACSSDARIPSTEDTEASADINTGVSNSPDEPSDTTDPIEPIDPFIPEPPVAPILPNPEDFVNVKQYIPSIFIDLRYSGTNNILGDNIYDYKDAYLRFGTVKKLNEVQKELEAQGLSLKIWDAYRPLDAQNTLSLVLPDYGTSPTEAYTAFNYGATLSLTIVRADGSEIPMPSDFDASGKAADRYFSDLPVEAAINATLLDTLMKKHGFEHYLAKWYRYSDADAEIYKISPQTSINENGLCTLSEKWTIEHESSAPFFSVGEDKSSKAIAHGETVELLFFNHGQAYIKYDGSYGLVSALHLVKKSDEYYKNDLLYIEAKDEYSYSDMTRDAKLLSEKYPEFIKLSSIGKSEEKRDLTLILLGNPDAEINIMIQASIHAREFITTTVLMSQIDYMLKNIDRPYELTGMTFREMLDKICFHIVPMSNPDGVEIVQTGVISSLYKGNRKGVDPRLWKANAKGIDLNANFDALWENYRSPSVPSPERYKGKSPETAAESKALANYIRKNPIDITLSYHTMGSVIFWDFPDRDKINALNLSLTAAIVSESGFYPFSDPTTCAGFRDWVILQGIPSLTVEMGVGKVPSVFYEFSQIWARSKDIIYETAVWALENENKLPNYKK